MFERRSGVLLHISSLPSEFGIGDLGPSAYRFVDFLNAAKQSFWQVLPLNPTDLMFGNSPYSSISAFATNNLLISPEILVDEGWLKKEDLSSKPSFPKGKVDYPVVINWKQEIFDIAYQRFRRNFIKPVDYLRFCKDNKGWLDDFSLFVILKSCFSNKAWNEWPDDIKYRQKQAIDKYIKKYVSDIEKVKFLQYSFFKQWFSLKKYCQNKGVRLIGDMPIYVSFDSVDVWTHPDIFKLDENEDPIFVAGVPPDYFSETGQRWGNPVYNWDRLKEQRYSWWLDRIRHNLKFFDILRIDHFRGLIAFWQIPAQEDTAVNGQWVGVPYDDFFTCLCSEFPDKPIIAEDLGIITKDVEEAMKRYGFPGMKVLLFAFNGDMQTHPYLPHNYTPDCVVYTGTHDNNTAKGWFLNEATQQEKENFFSYIGTRCSVDEVPWKLIELAMRSPANLAVIPVQDLLGLGAEYRMNTPGTTKDNWQWQLEEEHVRDDIINRLGKLTVETGRSIFQ